MNSTEIAASLNFSWLIEGEIAGAAAPMLPDDLKFLRSVGVQALVRMACPGKDDFVLTSSEVETAGLEDLHLPVEDFHAPRPDQIIEAVRFIERMLKASKPIAVSCGAGCGRTGTVLACFLVTRGFEPGRAIEHLIEKRPCSREIIERTPEQMKAIYDFARQRNAV